MKTGHKISLIYSSITISIVVIVGVVFYFFAANYTDSLYYSYLHEKAHLIGMERFEKDELNKTDYHHIVEERENAIPTDKHLILNMEDQRTNKILRKYLDEEQINNLVTKRYIKFKYGDKVAVGIMYYDNEGIFAILLFSSNPYGEQISHTIGYTLLIIMLLSALLLYLISRLYAIKMVDRIDQDYQTEKLFVNNASHEINNPLTAIQGECDIALMRERSASEYHSSLERIDKEVERVIRIMKQLLQFSYARREKIDEENLDNIQMGKILTTFTEATTQLDIIEDFSIIAKEDLLLIALRNLINNARKYSNGKGITITVDRPNIRIEDQGIGIPQTDLKHIFEPFYRATNTTSISGHGIGLALAKQILEKCDAKISVTSIEGQGTKFKIRFKRTITAIHQSQHITKVW